jgi:hypothetical protein
MVHELFHKQQLNRHAMFMLHQNVTEKIGKILLFISIIYYLPSSDQYFEKKKVLASKDKNVYMYKEKSQPIPSMHLECMMIYHNGKGS